MSLRHLVLLCMGLQAISWCQEADSGFELRGTLSGVAAYTPGLSNGPSGDPALAGARAILYPEWKINRNWSMSGAVQVHSRPYFDQKSGTKGFGAQTDIIQAQITYSRVRSDKSLVLRAGVLPSAFGSFMLRYDDAVNPLMDVPLSYGYYGSGISLNGFAAAEVDATSGKLDGRVQFLNSSPSNRRSVFDRDQYGTWAGGAGYTIFQGFRVGLAAFRGPYLDRHWPYYFPGEAKPKDLPGTGYGLEAQWGRGPWNAYGEMQRFVLTYRAIPTFREDAGYGELRRVLTPRWYIAARLAYMRSNAAKPLQVLESAVGYRLNAWQLIKFGHELEHGGSTARPWGNRFAIQFVSTLPAISVARN